MQLHYICRQEVLPINWENVKPLIFPHIELSERNILFKATNFAVGVAQRLDWVQLLI